jgi:hypothetical protein
MARRCKCFISKSKLILCEYNAFYFSEIAVIGFTVHEIKQGIVFFGTPGRIIQPCLVHTDNIRVFIIYKVLKALKITNCLIRHFISVNTLKLLALRTKLFMWLF